MIITMVSWIYIFTVSFLLGFGLFRLIRGKHMLHGIAAKGDGLVLYLMFGLCAASVYAQFFSLFHRVSALANLFLLFICLLIAATLRKQIWEYGIVCWNELKKPYVLIPLIIFGGLIWVMTNGVPSHYDTDLYHAQAIRWIEEYGVVKGLGNLHNRLAYNSSFFCLQALFSLKFIIGRSLHSLNGFIVLVMIMHAVTGLWIFHKRRIGISDLIKIVFLIYLFLPTTFTIFPYYAPGSDTLTMFLVLYISSTWAEYMEQGRNNPIDFGLCCLLSVWALTVKLSAAMLILLAIYPAVLLIKKKSWKTIGMFLLSGCLIVTPFLIRNVILSGYLLYPYPSLDIFNFDWKMPASMVAYDSQEIMAWGRSMRSPALYHASFLQWFPVWYGELSLFYRTLLWLNVALLILVLISLISLLYKWLKLPKQKNVVSSYELQRAILLITCTMGLLMWFFTAPSPRFGSVYFLLLPAIYGGSSYQMKSKHNRTQSFLPHVSCIIGVITACYLCCGSLYDYFYHFNGLTEWNPKDYAWYDPQVIEWEGIKIYAPYVGDQTGYQYFPATNFSGRLQYITLRTGQLKDGFKLKEEYRYNSFNSTGVPVQ